MRHTRTYFAFAALLLAAVAQAKSADLWPNRPDVVRSAERLAGDVEVFDETLHLAKAPTSVIERVHHFEQTVLDLVTDLRVITQREALREMLHVREDVEIIRRELRRYPSLMRKPRVSRAYQRMNRSYRKLDHEIYLVIPGPGPDPEGLSLNGEAYEIVGQAGLKSTETSVTGSGTIRFKDALKQGDNNFDLAFSLEDGGSLTLVGNADNGLEKGVEMTFARQGEGLKVTLKAGGKSDDLSPDFEQFSAVGALKLSIDIHEHGHIVVWVGDAEEQEYSFKTELGGLRWGLALNNAAVTRAKDGKAKDDHGHEH